MGRNNGRAVFRLGTCSPGDGGGRAALSVFADLVQHLLSACQVLVLAWGLKGGARGVGLSPSWVGRKLSGSLCQKVVCEDIVPAPLRVCELGR